MYNCNEFGEPNSIRVDRHGDGDFSLDMDPLSPSMLGSPIIAYAGGRTAHPQSPSEFVNDSGFIRRRPSLLQSRVEDLGNISSFSTSSPLLSSSRLDTSFEDMDASQLRRSLSEYITENTTLKSEIQEKDRQICKVKTQVRALLELETSGFQGSRDSADSNATTTDEEGEEEQTIENEIAEQDDIDDDIVQIIHDSTFVFIRAMTSRIDVDQAAIRERMRDGFHITNQIALGGVTGWVAAYLLKNFGKTAITAIGGGALILGFANRKGYVDINWNEIYEELQRQSEQRLNTSGEMEDQPDWTAEKIRNAKLWISNHSITVGGFVCGFLYKLF